MLSGTRPFSGPALDGDHPRPTVSPLLAGLWERYVPLMQERLRALDTAAAAAQQLELRPAERDLALDAAHKFAGSLGMFGFPEGTEVARELEHLLLQEEDPDSRTLLRLVQQLHTILHL